MACGRCVTARLMRRQRVRVRVQQRSMPVRLRRWAVACWASLLQRAAGEGAPLQWLHWLRVSAVVVLVAVTCCLLRVSCLLVCVSLRTQSDGVSCGQCLRPGIGER